MTVVFVGGIKRDEDIKVGVNHRRLVGRKAAYGITQRKKRRDKIDDKEVGQRNRVRSSKIFRGEAGGNPWLT